jgi:hypothetical protein
MPTRRTRGHAAKQARDDEGDDDDRQTGLLHTVALLVFAYLPLSIQAIAVPALSKAWKQWAQEEQRAKQRALEAAERVKYKTNRQKWASSSYVDVDVPLWAAQQHPGLTAALRRSRGRARRRRRRRVVWRRTREQRQPLFPRKPVRVGGVRRAAAGAAVAARPRLPVGQEHVRSGGTRRPPGRAAVGA